MSSKSSVAQSIALLRQEGQVFINPMMNAQKLREVVSKNKRHSIQRLMRPDNFDRQALLRQSRDPMSNRRKTVLDYFYLYTRNVLPKMEEKIELQLLERFKDRIGNAAERKEVMEAYYQRKDNLAKMVEPDDLRQPEKPDKMLSLPYEEMLRTIGNTEGEGLRFHTFEDIGKYTVFPFAHWQRMFPSEFYGRYGMDEYGRNSTLGIMTREEGLRLTNELSRLTLPHERNVDYLSIMTMQNTEAKHEVVKDEAMFTAI